MGVGEGTIGGDVGVGVFAGVEVGVGVFEVGVGEGTMGGVGVAIGIVVGVGVVCGVEAGVGVIATNPSSLICPLGLILRSYPECVPRSEIVAAVLILPVTVSNRIDEGSGENHTVWGRFTVVTGTSPSEQFAETVYPEFGDETKLTVYDKTRVQATSSVFGF